MRWYYDKKELRQTPSVKAGMSPEIESRYRREGARFIIEVGSQMSLSLTTMATGVVYYHRFYMFHSFQDFPRYPTACACLFLAGKVEETPKKCKDVIKAAKEGLDKDIFTKQFGEDPKNHFEEIMTLERILLQTIKFDLQVEHPYTFLLKYAKCLKGDKNRLQKMVQMAWTFVNDSLCTTLCLQWEPEIIAIALMYLAGKLSKFEVQDWNARTQEHLRWWDMFVENMSIDLLEDVCHQVLDLYSQTQNPVPSDSPPPRPVENALGHLNNHSAQASPSNQNSTPTLAGSSKTSTPIANPLTPTLTTGPPPNIVPTGLPVNYGQGPPPVPIPLPPTGYPLPPVMMPVPPPPGYVVAPPLPPGFSSVPPPYPPPNMRSGPPPPPPGPPPN